MKPSSRKRSARMADAGRRAAHPPRKAVCTICLRACQQLTSRGVCADVRSCRQVAPPLFILR